ncbi:MAG: TIGR02147 family protein [Oligoflexia bacterium]|nr:TIGR02147 family protein [Oligoflexia bacterium]
MSIFNFTDYKSFLKDLLKGKGEKRGFQGQLASAAGCQPAYLSQVLRSHVQLTPEHACNLAHFLGLDELESEYFLLLVDYSRAGTRRLRQRIQAQLDRKKREAENFANRLRDGALDSIEARSRYYSSWHWGAIHIITSIQASQTPEAISQRLNLPIEVVLETLRGLKTMGLVKSDNNRWQFTGGNLHIPKDSPLNGVNHQNWRLKAVQDSQNAESDGLHYTFCFTVTRSDYEKLKTMLLSFIDEQRKVIAPSACEDLVCFTYDLFRIS